ncbi:MAG: ZIP family metal transporter [Actinomycetota bacterium]|nr:ZIP family metal transporter [Actinomycetota bacterium]
MITEGQTWAYTLIALGAVSALSLVGAVTLFLQPQRLRKSMVLLIPFAAGALLGDAFIHLLPEVSESEHGFDLAASMSLLGGVIVFFVLEKILHWHHAHFPHEEVIHPVAVANLVGDSLHNFVDGAIVAAAFLVDVKVGVATAIAVALHEIPQELGDFAILVHAGLKPRRALALNLATAAAAVVGGVLTLVVASAAGIERVLIPFSAGAFVYIASTDLIPELHKEPEPGKSLVQLVALVGGVAVMALLLLVE